MKPIASRCAAMLALTLMAFAVAGCEKPPRPQEDAAVVNLWRIVQAYDMAENKLRRGPNNEEELRRFFAETGVTGDPDEYLRSPRDGEPYVILYGAMLDPEGRNIILAHEKNGVGGQRYVITLSRDVKLLTETEFANAEFAEPKEGKKKSPKK